MSEQILHHSKINPAMKERTGVLRAGLIILLLGLAAFFLVRGCNQFIVTAFAVQGGEYSFLNYASEFLTGCDFECERAPNSPQCYCTRSTLHAPSIWRAKHLHTDYGPDYRPFYRDASVVDENGQHGQDNSSQYGLEGARLIFYAGHGGPDYLRAFPGKKVELSQLSLGDGEVRYLWMISCNVMAHGKLASDGPRNVDFIHPEDFKPSEWRPERKDYRNVFYSWTKDYGGRSPLNRGLRLVCGGSSRIGSGYFPTRNLWHYRSILGLGPAESFLLGLYEPESFGIPLCMSRGGDRPESSGLYDSQFFSERPRKNLKKVYIEYPVKIKSPDPLAQEATRGGRIKFSTQRAEQTDDPKDLPVLVVDQGPSPSFLDGEKPAGGHFLEYGFKGGPAGALRASAAFLDPATGPLAPAALFTEDDTCVKRQRESGSTILALAPTARIQKLSHGDQWTVLENIGRAFVRRIMRDEEVFPPGVDTTEQLALREAQVVEMRVDGVLATKAASGRLRDEDISHFRGCRYLRLNRAYQKSSKDVPVPVSGDGGEVLLRLCPSSAKSLEAPADSCRSDSAPVLTLSFNKIIVKRARRTSFKTRTTAQNEAWTKLVQLQLGAERLYNKIPERTGWSYRAAPVHCKQKGMYIVYEFLFAPTPEAANRGYGPVTIEIPAHPLPGNAKRIEDTWTCSSE